MPMLFFLVLDAAAHLGEDVDGIIERLKSARMPKIVVLNKIDRVEDKPKLLELAKGLDERLAPDRMFMISALEGQGIKDLRTYLAGLVPKGPGTIRRRTSPTCRCGRRQAR